MKAPSAILGVLWLASALPAVEAPLAEPAGLTLSVKAPGRFELLWDPIFDDDLLGYSVWMRKRGEKEFTRLNVSVKTGAELRKTNIVSEARLPLKVPEGRDLELAVLAHYERGESARSASVFTALAARPLEAPSPDVAASAPAHGEVLRQRVLDEAAPPSEARSRRFEGKAPSRGGRLLTPRGGFRSKFGGDYEFKRSIVSGREAFGNLRLGGTGIPRDKVVEWRAVYRRSVLRLPLHLALGIFDGLEAWGEAAYHAEDAAIDDYVIDGQDFSAIRFVSVKDDGSVAYLSDPTSSGLGDSKLGVRIQPVGSYPLLVGAELSIPTGLSRTRAYVDWSLGARAYQAGTGEGVYRPALQVDLGKRGFAPGLSLRLRHRPGATETFSSKLMGFPLDHVFKRGDETELGLGYTLPWTFLDKEGSVVLGISGRSMGASSWTVNGRRALDGVHATETAWFENHTGLKEYRDDQLSYAVELVQGLPAGFEVGGMLSYTSAVRGDSLRLQGVFHY